MFTVEKFGFYKRTAKTDWLLDCLGSEQVSSNKYWWWLLRTLIYRNFVLNLSEKLGGIEQINCSKNIKRCFIWRFFLPIRFGLYANRKSRFIWAIIKLLMELENGDMNAVKLILLNLLWILTTIQNAFLKNYKRNINLTV